MHVDIWQNQHNIVKLKKKKEKQKKKIQRLNQLMTKAKAKRKPADRVGPWQTETTCKLK